MSIEQEKFDQRIKDNIKLTDIEQKSYDLRKEDIKRITKQLDIGIIIEKKERRGYQQQKLTKDLFEGIASTLGITANKQQSWLGKIEASYHSSTSLSETFKTIGKNMADMLEPGNVFANTTSTVLESTKLMAFQMDSTLASFNKATGAGGAYNKQIDEVRFGSLEAGVG